jgi:hypothetical protein
MRRQPRRMLPISNRNAKREAPSLVRLPMLSWFSYELVRLRQSAHNRVPAPLRIFMTTRILLPIARPFKSTGVTVVRRDRHFGLLPHDQTGV